MEYEENDCVSALFQTLELEERKWTGLQYRIIRKYFRDAEI
jgi:hypothetical protein